MAESEETAMVIDADALLESAEPAAPVTTESEPAPEPVATQEAASTETAVIDADATGDAGTANEGDETVVPLSQTEDVVTKVFTAVDEGGNEVQYVTMTQEEAEAAAVEEEEQVVTTSLQFDPANPSVLYTADGTPINQADLSPEEQALVQAALQQHLAEQEAEQQLALIEQSSGEGATAMEQEVAADSTQVSAAVINSEDAQDTTAVALTSAGDAEPQLSMAETSADPVAVITPAVESATTTTGVDIVSSTTTASSIVQSLADNVRREQEYKKAQDLLDRAAETSKAELPEGFRYEEKIVIRQGQPQVVKVPVRAPVAPKRPEIPAVLANLMPKVEIGKDGSQVIRIHQSQITADQLKSLQENPNVRLVFRPASSNRGRGGSGQYNYPKKRGRPRKNYISAYSPGLHRNNDDPSSKSGRYGRAANAPYYQKDYLGGELENGDGDKMRPPSQVYPMMPGRRGRPPGSVNRNAYDRGYRRAPSFARKMEQLREQEFQHDEELNNARLSIVPQKPVLSSVELAISTRRKNRLRELLSACSEDEIMEVALPHLARVFSLWEFLIMKVEKNKLSRVYFADVYKEYEILHRYMSRLTGKYKQALMEEKLMRPANGGTNENEANMEAEKKKFLKVRCKMLAQSLGLEEDDLEDAFITLLDAEEVVPPPPKPTQSTSAAKETDPSQLSSDSALAAQPGENADVAMKESSETETAALAEDATEKDAQDGEKIDTEKSEDTAEPMDTATAEEGEATGGTQIIQIGTGEDKQFIEVPEGYTLIQTPEGLVMSQPGTTLSQAEDGTIYVTHEDGTTSTLDSQKTVPLESVESLITEEQQEEAAQ